MSFEIHKPREMQSNDIYLTPHRSENFAREPQMPWWSPIGHPCLHNPPSVNYFFYVLGYVCAYSPDKWSPFPCRCMICASRWERTGMFACFLFIALFAAHFVPVLIDSFLSFLYLFEHLMASSLLPVSFSSPFCFDVKKRNFLLGKYLCSVKRVRVSSAFL